MREAELCEALGIPQEKFTHVGLMPIAYYEGDGFKQAWRRPVVVAGTPKAAASVMRVT